MFPSEFRGEVNHEETSHWAILCEDPIIVARAVLTYCQRVTDRQTNGQMDGQTDLFTIASTALSMLTRCKKSRFHKITEIKLLTWMFVYPFG